MMRAGTERSRHASSVAYEDPGRNRPRVFFILGTMQRSQRMLRTLALGLLAVLLVARLDAGSDPLRQMPRTVQQKAPAPPAKKGPGGGEKAETEPGSPALESRTAVTTAASASLERPVEGKHPVEGMGRAGGEAASQAMGSEDGSYRLGPRDQLKIEVWNRAEPEYDWRPVTVADDGSVNLPLLDNVKIGGLSVTDAAKALTRLYDSFIIEPQVFIQIVEYNSRQINVVGEVKNPGRFSLKGEMSLTQVIAQAGDLTKYASRVVRVIRIEGAGKASSEVIEVDLDRINAGDARADIRIQPDDQIYVLTNKNIVYVSGMVKAEGYVDFEEGLTAQQAVILAGGLSEGSAGGRTKVFRVVGEKTESYKVNVKDQKKTFPLQPGDIIHVPRSIL